MDDFDAFFRMLERAMGEGFSGGYRRDSNRQRSDNSDIDILEDENHIYITIELRELQESDINVTIEDDLLVLQLLMEGSWYRKSLRLPKQVNPKSMKVLFNNGIMDIELEKVKENELPKRIRGKSDISYSGSCSKVK